jgi:hypothetical protein
MLSFPLVRVPRYPLFSGPPRIAFHGPIRMPQPRWPNGFLNIVRRFIRPCRRNAPPVPLPPSDYPYGDLLRSSDVLIYHDRDDAAETLLEAIRFLKDLLPGKAPSTRLIIVTAPSPGLTTSVITTARKEYGDVHLARTEPSVSPILALDHAALTADPARLPHDIQQLTSRLAPFRLPPSGLSLMAPADLPRLVLPPGDDYVLLGPFLAAARLRSTPPVVGSNIRNNAWPIALDATDGLACGLEIARRTLADLLTHQLLLGAGTHERYEDAWIAQHNRVRDGETRAESVVIAVVGSDDKTAERMKLLPAILYSAQIPAPLICLRIDLRKQLDILQKFHLYTSAVADFWQVAFENRDRANTVGILRVVEQKRNALQKAFLDALPKELFQFLNLVKPKELIHFSALPLDWLEMDGVPLGYLTRMTSVRSAGVESDANGPADIAIIYTGLVAKDLRPSHRAFSIAVIAPTYPDGRQKLINEHIALARDVVIKRLHEQQQRGAELTITTAGTRAEVLKLFQERWSVIFYIGHAAEGTLKLPDGPLTPEDLPEHALLGTTAVLLGCDTQGASNVTGSIASLCLSYGARAVFATYYPIEVGLADLILFNLMNNLIAENMRFGDALIRTRVAIMSRATLYCLGMPSGAPIDEKISGVELEFEKFRDSWDGVYRYFLDQWPSELRENGSLITRWAALAGLALSFSGDPRDRLIEL